jgi:hypothetical protein
VRSVGGKKPNGLKEDELNHQNDPEEITEFFCFMTKDFLGENRSDTSARNSAVYEHSFTDAAGIFPCQILIVSE